MSRQETLSSGSKSVSVSGKSWQSGLQAQLEMYSVLNAYAGGGLDTLEKSHLVALNNNLHTLRNAAINLKFIHIFISGNPSSNEQYFILHEATQ
jgi:hypothetical protein